ncbi:MAG: ferrous iron transport protein B [Cryomorphaceae bacterium]|nr:ferrous iron transport protein B [Flavobacteriales bacterium]
MSLSSGPQTVALAGVPNVGKSTVFNSLTGLRQKVGNYPGITVDKKSGILKSQGSKVEIIDLPGTYNLYPRSEDEQVVFRVLCGLEPGIDVDAIVAVADMSNPERSLFFVSQLIDLGLPMALVLNMHDQAEKDGIRVNKTILERLLGIPVYIATADKGVGMDEVRNAIASGHFKKGRQMMDIEKVCKPEMLAALADITGIQEPYRAFQWLKFRSEGTRIDATQRKKLEKAADNYGFDPDEARRSETKARYEGIREILAKCVKSEEVVARVNYTRKLDAVFLHRYAGFAIFLGLLFVIFQAIFAWAEAPMEAIDQFFAYLSFTVSENLPAGALNDLVAEGILPGLGGIMIFIPQIALLFAFLAILEGSGYMARAVFITDKAMRPFGLNGRSVVPLISGFACAIPAIMATRTISNKRDRLITIFVTPFMSCAARLPVYIVLIGLVMDSEEGSMFDQRGMALFAMYLLGIAAALVSALLLKWAMKREPGGHLVMELPRYSWPNPKTVAITMYEKSRTFVFEAGKVILAISIVLWVMASYGPGDAIENAEASVPVPEATAGEEAFEAYEVMVSTRRLEASYAGQLGRFIEPAIAPLGYDWKVGIALITSFAAREVFVSTMATLYSIGASEDDMTTIQERLSGERNPQTGGPFFTKAVVWSLLVFYAFAMQCMSTIAIVYRETKSWKWPAAQTLFMTLLAYFAALGVYQFLS